MPTATRSWKRQEPPLEPPEGINSVHTLICQAHKTIREFQLLEHYENRFLLFQATKLWEFVARALGNLHRGQSILFLLVHPAPSSFLPAPRVLPQSTWLKGTPTHNATEYGLCLAPHERRQVYTQSCRPSPGKWSHKHSTPAFPSWENCPLLPREILPPGSLL